MRRHLSSDALASYQIGEVGRRRAARIRAHLARCARCAGVSSDLAEVSSVLASVQLPRIPDRLAERLHTALAAEASARAASPGQITDIGASEPGLADSAIRPLIPGRPDLPDRTRPPKRHRAPRRAPRLVLLTVGVAAVTVAGGVLVVVRLLNGMSGITASAPGTAMGHRAVIKAPGFGVSRGPVPLSYSRNGVSATTTVIRSSVNFETARLGAQLRHEVASHLAATGSNQAGPSASGRPAAGIGAKSQQNSTLAPAPTSRSLSEADRIGVKQLGACVTRVAAGREVLLVEVARFQGRRAIVIVVATPASARRLSVWVVGTGCSATRSDVIVHRTIPAR
jgi:hypothetical protein